MNVYQVIPHQGVAPIRLGMTRAESRAAMALPFKSYKKTFTSGPLTDAYLESCFQVYFDDFDRVDYIELSRGMILTALYHDMSVFENEAQKVIAFIQQDAEYDHNDRELGYSYIFPSLDLSLWRSTIPENIEDEDGRYFMTIGVGKVGYYSEM